MKTITQDAHYATLAAATVQREREIYSYQVNIDNFRIVLGGLPTEWPDDLLKYRGLTTEQIARDVPAQFVAAVADLNFRDQVARRLIAEQIEQDKARRVYDALLAQLPADRRDELLAQAASAGA